MSVQAIAVWANLGLALLKFFVGFLAGSRALIADAYNSAGDVLATSIAWGAFRFARRPPDANHPYGHGNAEAVAGVVIGVMLCATGMFIAIDGVLGILEDQHPEPPKTLALYVAGITAVTKEILYRVSMKVGRRTGSPTLLASARDHRADVLSALGALVGVLVARMGFPMMDRIAAAGIGLYILALGWQPVRQNLGILMLEAPPEFAERASSLAMEDPGVVSVRQVRVQPTGGRYRMDMVLIVDGAATVAHGHEVAHRVEELIRAAMERVDEVHVHVEPGEGSPATGSG